jgi:hypothetical protein
MTLPNQTDQTFLLANNFQFGHVPSRPGVPEVQPVPPLGPLQSFVGTFRGNGFNIIFRPQSTASPTPLPNPVPALRNPVPGGISVLELNLTSETLSFTQSLGSVPNRGMVQGDIFLNGVPYVQTITDVTDPANPVGIHVEPGLWMAVPATTAPAQGPTLVRMASIPHGVSFVAQGTSSTASGPPTIPAVSINPCAMGTPPPGQPVPSQTATNSDTARIPQDLTSFIAAGTITQEMLDDPNTLLRNHIASQKILSTTTVSISTVPLLPSTRLLLPSPSNIPFLSNITFAPGDAAQGNPNAQVVCLTATFWIETVELNEHAGPTPVTGNATTTQIQYSQEVLLEFNSFTWPHVSVATLVQAEPAALSHPVVLRK